METIQEELMRLRKENAELKVANKTKLNTPIGEMEMGLLTDPDYPGMYIDLKLQDDEVVGNAVTIEYDAEAKDFIIRVWKHEIEDRIARIEWSK